MVKEKNKKLIQRLKRIEGQVGGLIRMCQSGRSCEEMVQQIRAVRSGLDGVSVIVLKSELCKNMPFSKKEKTGIMLEKLLKIK